MFLCLVKYSLAGYYGRLPGFQMHEMTPEVISRKRQVCEEALAVISKIDHEIGVRKGLNIIWKFLFRCGLGISYFLKLLSFLAAQLTFRGTH